MISYSKVERLLTDFSAGARAETAAIVGREFVDGAMSEAEKGIAIDILMVLANDVDQTVREALAEQVKSCPFLPRPIGLTLARDLDPVAVPILRCSPVLTDSDLVALVGDGSTAKQIAIAQREHVAAIVAAALVDTRNRKVVKQLLVNRGATLSEATLSVLVDRFPEDRGIQLLMAERPEIPPAVIERLLACASAEVAARLVLHESIQFAGQSFNQAASHAASPLAGDAELQCGRAFSQLLALLSPDEIERLTASLHGRGMLRPMLLLRCLCDGNLCFFESALGALCGIPLLQARAQIHERGARGLSTLLDRAGLPAVLTGAYWAALRAIQDTALGPSASGPAALTTAVVARLRRTYPALKPTADGDLDEMLRRLEQLLPPVEDERLRAANPDSIN